MNASIWEKTSIQKRIKNKFLPKETDILIIGGGIAGISTAFHLKDSPYKVTLIDKGDVGQGVTAKTTGKLTFLQGLIYDKIKNIYNEEKSFLYLRSQKEAIDIVKSIVDEYKIKCDLTKTPSYVFTEEEKEIKNLKKETELLDKASISYKENQNLPIPYPCKYAFSVEDTYVFHPLKYLESLVTIIKKQDILICEQTMADTITKREDFYLVHTNRGFIKAQYVVVCTHYPFFIKPGFIPFKSHIEKSYVLASKTKNIQNFSAILSKKPSYSMRYYKNHFIYGGYSHRMSDSTNYEENYDTLLEHYLHYFQNKPDYMWSTHDIITEDSLPYIGKIKEDNPFLLLATGFNKWGMTNGTIAGKVLSDLILGRENPYIELFAPYRKYNIKRTLELLKNGLGTSKIYAETKLKRNPSFYKNHVRVYKENGIYYGEYTDEENIKHTVLHKCPHMGCSLIFNSKDKTWDCPCHGSRFTVDGSVIEGPSTMSISVEKD
ncbi:MAG: FAD-dependent oxidoreductase [Bacilli bacterium]|nr:FAD-dependent oxidoreductase [Bacilli bacterium]